MAQIAWVLFVFAVIGAYYFYYLQKVKKAGGHAAIHARVQREKFGLAVGELVVHEFAAEMHEGGRRLAIAITSNDRLVISVAPLEEDEGKFDASLGDTGYRPMTAFDAGARPQLVDADVALARPHEVRTRTGDAVSADLVVIQPKAQASPLSIWLEHEGVTHLSDWCARGT